MNRDLSALLLWRRPPARSPWLRRLRRELGGERGSVSVWMITTAVTMMLCLGLGNSDFAFPLNSQSHPFTIFLCFGQRSSLMYGNQEQEN